MTYRKQVYRNKEHIRTLCPTISSEEFKIHINSIKIRAGEQVAANWKSIVIYSHKLTPLNKLYNYIKITTQYSGIPKKNL